MYLILSIFFILILIFLVRKKKLSFDKKFNPDLIGNDIENYLNMSESKITGILPWTKKELYGIIQIKIQIENSHYLHPWIFSKFR